MILGGAAVGLFFALALLAVMVSKASTPEPPHLKTVLFASMAGCGLIIGFGQALRKQKAWAWDTTMVLFAMAALLAGIPPFWMIDGGRHGAALIVVFGCSAATLAVIAYAMRAFASAPVRAAYLQASEIPAALRVIAALQWASAAAYLVAIPGSLQTRVFGYPVAGVSRTLYYVILGGVSAFFAFGLYRMKEVARRWAIWFLLLTFADSVAWSIATPTPHGGFSWMRAATLTMCLVMDSIIIWYLVTRRGCFLYEAQHP